MAYSRRVRLWPVYTAVETQTKAQAAITPAVIFFEAWPLVSLVCVEVDCDRAAPRESGFLFPRKESCCRSRGGILPNPVAEVLAPIEVRRSIVTNILILQ